MIYLNNNNSKNSDAKKVLVTYFSVTGATKQITNYIAQDLKADTFEIVPEVTDTFQKNRENPDLKI